MMPEKQTVNAVKISAFTPAYVKIRVPNIGQMHPLMPPIIRFRLEYGVLLFFPEKIGPDKFQVNSYPPSITP